MTKKAWFFPLLIVFLASLIWFFSLKLLYSPYLTFSDAAKFADVAREMVQSRGFTTNFGFFNPRFIFTPEAGQPIVPGFGILNALVLAVLFKILGISDFAVVLNSGLFFIVGSLLIYLIAQKLFDQRVAFFSALVFIFTQPILDYASIGASELLFISLLLASIYLVLLKKRFSLYVSAAIASLLLLTRIQAPIYLFGLALFIFLYSDENKRRRLFSWLVSLTAAWIALFFFSRLTGQKFIHFEFLPSLFYERAIVAKNVSLRGGVEVSYFNLTIIKSVITKAFYNLYNFYKLLPSFVSPYLVCLYLLSLSRWNRKDEANALQLGGFVILTLSLLAVSLTVPFMRYIHPVIPIVIIFSVEMLIWLLIKIFKKDKKVWIAAFLVILFFVVGQTLGKIFLDSRHLRAHTNQGKPPAYVQLSQLLKENTNPDDLIITNLDTWGSWYGERKTIWFPLQPEQLIPEQGRESKIDAIYLTSYKMDDENYYMGENWREIFYHPEELEEPFFADNFEFAREFKIEPEETYEREGARAILLIKK